MIGLHPVKLALYLTHHFLWCLPNLYGAALYEDLSKHPVSPETSQKLINIVGRDYDLKVD